MRFAARLMALALGGVCAGVAQLAPAEPARTISLRVGESAEIADAGLRVGFDGVSADSRCPIGTQCVWAGDATVGIWLQRGSAPKAMRELHTAAGAANAVTEFGQEVRLLRLDPAPHAATVGLKPDYRLTLTLTPGSVAAPER